MIPDPDWNDPAAVKRYQRKVIRRDLLLVIVVICGLGSMAMAILLMLRPL